MKTIAQLQKEANKASKFVLFTNEFGFDIFIADTQKTGGLEITETEAEALQFALGYDDADSKLKAWSYVTGYQLKVKKLEN